MNKNRWIPAFASSNNKGWTKWRPNDTKANCRIAFLKIHELKCSAFLCSLWHTILEVWQLNRIPLGREGESLNTKCIFLFQVTTMLKLRIFLKKIFSSSMWQAVSPGRLWLYVTFLNVMRLFWAKYYYLFWCQNMQHHSSSER